MTQTTAIHGEKSLAACACSAPATSGLSASASCSSASTWAGTSPSAKAARSPPSSPAGSAGLLYTCVAMIDSEVTSTVAAAGGQYAQAKHIVGPLMAFNVGLFLVLAYTMLEAGNAITAGYLVQAVGGMAGFEGVHDKPFIVLTIMCAGVAQLSRRVRDAHLQPHHHRHRLLRHRRAVRGRSPVDRRRPQAGGAAHRACPTAGSASSPRCTSACGSTSASRARRRRPKRFARRRARCRSAR